MQIRAKSISNILIPKSVFLAFIGSIKFMRGRLINFLDQRKFYLKTLGWQIFSNNILVKIRCFRHYNVLNNALNTVFSIVLKRISLESTMNT